METGEGNLLELAVEAARARASKGEISDAVEKFVVDIKQLFVLYLVYIVVNLVMMMLLKKFVI